VRPPPRDGGHASATRHTKTGGTASREGEDGGAWGK
jgi:hypothetical protein